MNEVNEELSVSMDEHVAEGRLGESTPPELRVKNLGIDSVFANSFAGQRDELAIDNNASDLPQVGEEIRQPGEGGRLVEILHREGIRRRRLQLGISLRATAKIS